VQKQDRKAAIAAYKERKSVPGVFAVRCAATGEAWVGGWADVEKIQNRIWFSLRNGAHTNPELLAAWKQHGEAQFRFEVLERLDEKDDAFFSPNAFLKTRAAHWVQALNAKPI
jgi:hypothetical protein